MVYLWIFISPMAKDLPWLRSTYSTWGPSYFFVYRVSKSWRTVIDGVDYVVKISLFSQLFLKKNGIIVLIFVLFCIDFLRTTEWPDEFPGNINDFHFLGSTDNTMRVILWTPIYGKISLVLTSITYNFKLLSVGLWTPCMLFVVTEREREVR